MQVPSKLSSFSRDSRLWTQVVWTPAISSCLYCLTSKHTLHSNCLAICSSHLCLYPGSFSQDFQCLFPCKVIRLIFYVPFFLVLNCIWSDLLNWSSMLFLSSSMGLVVLVFLDSVPSSTFYSLKHRMAVWCGEVLHTDTKTDSNWCKTRNESTLMKVLVCTS